MTAPIGTVHGPTRCGWPIQDNLGDVAGVGTSNRPYRTGMPADRALSIIARNDGPQWDPTLVAAFLTLHESEPWVLSSDLMSSEHMPE